MTAIGAKRKMPLGPTQSLSLLSYLNQKIIVMIAQRFLTSKELDHGRVCSPR